MNRREQLFNLKLDIIIEMLRGDIDWQKGCFFRDLIDKELEGATNETEVRERN